jgi:hypothetical protein
MDRNCLSPSIVILNDLRAVPLLAALKIVRNTDSSIFVAHESIFENNEYADYTNGIWKRSIKYVLRLFFSLKVIGKSHTHLPEFSNLGVASSLQSITEDSSADQEKYPEIFKQIQCLALGAIDIIEYLTNIQEIIRSVYIFNGRTASSYPVTKFCVQKNISVIYYEYAGHCNGFRLFPLPPHASERLGKLILQYYRFGLYNLADQKVYANILIGEKLNSYHSKANKDVPVKNYDVVIFLGSDFEYTSVDPEICGVNWIGNPRFCKKVIEKYGTNCSYAIRCHPNSAKDPNWELLYDELKADLSEFDCLIDIYGPDKSVDSHQLIVDAKYVVTDLSTISLDAIFLGKMVDIFGNTDIKFISENKWMCEYSGDNLLNTMAEPFALAHNFLVFRFGYFEKILCRALYLVNRSFEKFVLFRRLRNHARLGT